MVDLDMSQLASKFASAADKVGPLAAEKMRTLAAVGEGHMKRAIQEVHAVDTGTMLNSTVAVQTGKTSWLVGPTVAYAPYVALGTSRMPARPFHLMAAKATMEDAKEIFKVEDLGL
jgi:HK97 gp10 family phage protein